MSHFLNFSKMHGLGNDFVVTDAITQAVKLDQIPFVLWSDRHLGIGFDQFLLIEKTEQADFSCRIFNADGSEAEQCGNGMRCVARYILEKKLSEKKSLTIATLKNLIEIEIHDFDRIEVNMGSPQFSQKNFPSFHPDKIKGKIDVLSMGNPHVILQVEELKNFPIKKLGEELSVHEFFPEGVNAGFVEIINRQHIKLRTFERGAGETLACGSNACAAVAAGINQQKLDKKVKVELPLGNLWIEWHGEGTPVKMIGGSAKVFDGVISY